MNIRLLLIIFFILSAGFYTIKAQDVSLDDSLHVSAPKKSFFQKVYSYFDESNDEKRDKKFDVSFIGGPHFSNDTKFGIGLVASGLYRLDRNDYTLPPSDISLYSDVTTSGSFAIGFEGNTIFPKNKYRLNFDLFFSSLPSKYWGIGYDKGKHQKQYSKYTQQQIQMKVDFLKHVTNNLYLGVTLTAQDLKGVSVDDWNYFEGLRRHNTAIGGGLILSYDSRDFIPNPYKGVYIKLEQNFYPEFLGSTQYFNRTEFIARYYKKLWDTGVLAFDFQGIFNNGDVPWSMVAQMGSSRQMRGYYKGQYRDEKLLQTQVELRQKIYGRSGAVIWAGAGNVFPAFSDFEWRHTLPTFGIGYRWEFKNRVNVRLDYGIGKGQTSFYFNINEAF